MPARASVLMPRNCTLLLGAELGRWEGDVSCCAAIAVGKDAEIGATSSDYWMQMAVSVWEIGVVRAGDVEIGATSSDY